MKLNLKDKLDIVDLYKEGMPQSLIAIKYNVSESTIWILTRQYREHGRSSFSEKGKNIKYRPEYKLEIVNRILNGESKSSIAAEVKINVGQIYSWYKKYKTLGYNGLKQDLRGAHMKKNKPIKPKGNLTKDEEIKYLKEKNEQLEMELDLLKKLNALVRQRKEPPKAKK